LPLDLAYACGEKGNAAQRKHPNREFYRHLCEKAGTNEAFAAVRYAAVRWGGSGIFRLPLSWPFA
jgi:hypothetical protein